MNLTTHWVLALAIGLGIFHNVQIALVMSIGALIPDLDREYFFVAKGFIGKHQLHRSLFHNFFTIGALYLVNPFLALGALTHSALDMLTSASDRGIELLFPLTRFVGNYHNKIDGGPNPHSPEKMEWWVEDPWRLVQGTSDRDLREPPGLPWRRSYGPFKNNRVFDWGVFFGSIVFLGADYGIQGSSSFSMSGYNPLVFVSLVGIAIFYGLGEWWRRKLWKLKLGGGQEPPTNWVVLVGLIVGVTILLLGGVYLWQPPAPSNLGLIAAAVISIMVGLVAGYLLVRARHGNDLSL